MSFLLFYISVIDLGTPQLLLLARKDFSVSSCFPSRITGLSVASWLLGVLDEIDSCNFNDKLFGLGLFTLAHSCSL